MSSLQLPLLTIGIPVYNAMPFLPETINSLLHQDHVDFNIFIIDDGSTDGSAEYLKTVKDRRVRIVRQENKGITFTRNRLLKEAETPWFVSNDHDDISYPNRLRLIMEFIQKYPSAGMFYSLAKYYGKNSIGSFKTSVASPTVLSNLTKAGHLLAICQSTIALNIQKALDVGGYRSNMHVDGVEDVDLFWRLALRNDIILIPEFTAEFRLSFSSVSSKTLVMQSIQALFVQYLLLSHLWGMSPMPYDEIKNILTLMLDNRKIRFRENIRKINIYAGKGEYIKVFTNVVKSFITHPGYFLARADYELRENKIAVNGVDPKMFAALSDNLWK